MVIMLLITPATICLSFVTMVEMKVVLNSGWDEGRECGVAIVASTCVKNWFGVIFFECNSRKRRLLIKCSTADTLFSRVGMLPVRVVKMTLSEVV